MPAKAIALGPLALPPENADLIEVCTADAVRLLLAKGRELAPGFAEGEGEARLLGEIARHLEGLPLALEIAAAMAARKGARALAEALRDAAPAAPSSAAHVPLCLVRLWPLLDEEEQTVLAQCAVFEASFSLVAAARVVVLDGGANE